MAGRNRRRGLAIGKAAPWLRTVARKGGSRKRRGRVEVVGIRTVRVQLRKLGRLGL